MSTVERLSKTSGYVHVAFTTVFTTPSYRKLSYFDWLYLLPRANMHSLADSVQYWITHRYYYNTDLNRPFLRGYLRKIDIDYSLAFVRRQQSILSPTCLDP